MKFFNNKFYYTITNDDNKSTGKWKEISEGVDVQISSGQYLWIMYLTENKIPEELEFEKVNDKYESAYMVLCNLEMVEGVTLNSGNRLPFLFNDKNCNDYGMDEKMDNAGYIPIIGYADQYNSSPEVHVIYNS